MGVKIKTSVCNGPSAIKNTPTVRKMVTEALESLKDRQGSSLVAIKKKMTELFNVDPSQIASHIKKFIKTSLLDGTLIQTKGNGASGSFKLAKKARNSRNQKENQNKTPRQVIKKTKTKKKPKVRTPARKALFQTPQPGKPKPKARLFAIPIPPSPFSLPKPT